LKKKKKKKKKQKERLKKKNALRLAFVWSALHGWREARIALEKVRGAEDNSLE